MYERHYKELNEKRPPRIKLTKPETGWVQLARTALDIVGGIALLVTAWGLIIIFLSLGN